MFTEEEVKKAAVILYDYCENVKDCNDCMFCEECNSDQCIADIVDSLILEEDTTKSMGDSSSEQGMTPKEVWSMVQEICRMGEEERDKYFGCPSFMTLFIYSLDGVIKVYRSYKEESAKIHIGDEVYSTIDEDVKIIVTQICEGNDIANGFVTGLDSNFIFRTISLDTAKKTGRNFANELKNLFSKIK